MIRVVTKYIIQLLIIFFIQIVVLNNVTLFNSVHPYLYLIFIFMLPMNLSISWVLLISFFIGLVIDIFSYTYGIHAMSSVLIGYIRPYLLKAFFRDESTELLFEPHYKTLGIRNFLIYITVLTFIHHFILLIVEAFGFYDFLYTIFKITINTVLSFIVILLYDLIAVSKKE